MQKLLFVKTDNCWLSLEIVENVCNILEMAGNGNEENDDKVDDNDDDDDDDDDENSDGMVI